MACHMSKGGIPLQAKQCVQATGTGMWSHNLCSLTSAVSCKRATSLGEARSLAGMEGQSFTWTGTPILAAALAAWLANALPPEIRSLDLVWAIHLTTSIDEGSWHK